MSRIHRPALLQAEAGLAALMLGVLVYVATRSGQQVFFLQYLATGYSGFHFEAGGILYSLPSFLHIYAFILLTAAIGSGSRRHLRMVCLSWLVMELLFEFAQQQALAEHIVEYLPAWFYGSAVLETVPDYFLLGTYDPLDIVFLVLGALAAYITAIHSLKGA